MSAKKPRFKPRVMLADKHGNTYQRGEDPSDKTRVRVTDARDLTAEKAVERMLNHLVQNGCDEIGTEQVGESIFDAVASIGMSARVVNGKVRVRSVKR